MIEIDKRLCIELFYDFPPDYVEIIDIENNDLHFFLLNILEPKTCIRANITCEGLFEILPPPQRYRIKEIQRFCKDFSLPKQELNVDIEPIFRDNFNLQNTPACCYQKDGIIEFSSGFYNMPYYVRCFIICHELGHFFYNDEQKTDLYSLKHYLNYGFNPCLALNSMAYYLNWNKENIERYNNVYRKIMIIQK